MENPENIDIAPFADIPTEQILDQFEQLDSAKETGRVMLPLQLKPKHEALIHSRLTRSKLF